MVRSGVLPFGGAKGARTGAGLNLATISFSIRIPGAEGKILLDDFRVPPFREGRSANGRNPSPR
jgi:hypothetical protein